MHVLLDDNDYLLRCNLKLNDKFNNICRLKEM
jgi:hypothetical protein